MFLKKFKKTIKKAFLFTLILLLLAFLGLYAAYKKDTNDKSSNKNITPCQSEIIEPSNEIPSQINTSQSLNNYSNYEAYFSLNYPVDLELHEVRRSGCIDQQAGYSKGYPSALWLIGWFSDAQRYGQIGICAGDVDFENDGCGEGGMSILYGIPTINGKGGLCTYDSRQIRVDGQEAWACFAENGFLVSYPSHPEGISELNILALYGEEFPKETAMEILESLRFEDKN